MSIQPYQGGGAQAALVPYAPPQLTQEEYEKRQKDVRGLI